MSDLLTIADDVVAQAQPGEALEVYLSSSTSTSVAIYKGDVESLTQAGSAGVGIRVVRDGRTGFAWTASLDRAVIAEALSEARDNLPFAEPDDFTDLAEPDGIEARDIDLYRDEVLSTSTADKIEIAKELERLVLAADKRVESVPNASYSDFAGSYALASTTGIRVGGRSSRASASVAALALDGKASAIAGGFDMGRAPGDISTKKAADDAITRLLAKLGSVKPASGRVTLVLEPRMTSTILGVIAGMLSGETVAKGRSPFTDRLGEQVGASNLTIVEDPTNPDSPGAMPYDDEGLACRRIALIDEGTLGGFLHNSISARRMGTVSTASASRSYKSRPGVSARSLAISPGEGNLDSLVESVEDGVLITAMTGLHSGVNAVSGDFSVGIEGIRIRSGKRCEPVKEATVATTLQRMLLDVEAVGADLEWQPGGTGAVSLVIPGVSLSGT